MFIYHTQEFFNWSYFKKWNFFGCRGDTDTWNSIRFSSVTLWNNGDAEDIYLVLACVTRVVIAVDLVFNLPVSGRALEFSKSSKRTNTVNVPLKTNALPRGILKLIKLAWEFRYLFWRVTWNANKPTQKVCVFICFQWNPLTFPKSTCHICVPHGICHWCFIYIPALYIRDTYWKYFVHYVEQIVGATYSVKLSRKNRSPSYQGWSKLLNYSTITIRQLHEGN